MTVLVGTKSLTIAAVMLCLLEISSASTSTTTTTTPTTTARSPFGVSAPIFDISSNGGSHALQSVVELRGGASKRKTKTASSSKTVTGKKKVSDKSKKQAETPMDDFSSFFKSVPPITRAYMCAMVAITFIGNLIGEERAHAAFGLNPMRLFFGMEIWRPFTAACFLGAPSMNWMLSGYNLFKYGSQLERAYGGAQFMLFMFTQLFLLTFMSTLLGQPFFPLAVITGMLQVLSRTTPNEQVQFFVMKVSYWMLPVCNAFADFVNAQGSLGALLPHIMGMLSGHFYYFNKTLWPQMPGGEDWLLAPDFLVSIMNDDSSSSKSKDAVNKALKKRKKGKKLGSA